MAEPTIGDIDALVGPATPHFAYQLRARVRELIEDLPGTTRCAATARRRWSCSTGSAMRRRRRRTAGREPRARPGWETIPSSAPAYAPLPRRPMSFDGRVGPRDRRLARDRQGDRAPLRRARRDAGGDRLPALRPRRRGDGRGAAGARRRAGARARQRLVRPRARGGRRRSGRSTRSCTTRRRGVIRPALETEDKHWDWTLDANARALLSLAARRGAARCRPARRSSALSSLGSKRVLENYSLVGTSKAALEALVRYLAVELGAARDPRQRGLGRRRRDRRARALPEPRGDARAGRPQPRRPARDAGGRRRRRSRSSARRTRRWSAARRSSSTAATRCWPRSSPRRRGPRSKRPRLAPVSQSPPTLAPRLSAPATRAKKR